LPNGRRELAFALRHKQPFMFSKQLDSQTYQRRNRMDSLKGKFELVGVFAFLSLYESAWNHHQRGVISEAGPEEFDSFGRS
jgi:hypothetical protein